MEFDLAIKHENYIKCNRTEELSATVGETRIKSSATVSQYSYHFNELRMLTSTAQNDENPDVLSRESEGKWEMTMCFMLCVLCAIYRKTKTKDILLRVKKRADKR